MIEMLQPKSGMNIYDYDDAKYIRLRLTKKRPAHPAPAWAWWVLGLACGYFMAALAVALAWGRLP